MIAQGLALALLAATLALHPACAAGRAALPSDGAGANFEHEPASREARHVADWVLNSGDNGGMPYVIVDKVGAKVFVFDGGGRLRGAAAALLGLTRGDVSVPGIGARKLSAIRPEERTTPAGRFLASLARGLDGSQILWVDYESGVALHRVIAGVPQERRLQRLASPVALERRITYGCINVPVRFFDDVVSPAFTGTNGIVYVLPETRSAREVFGSPAAGVRHGGRVPGSSR